MTRLENQAKYIIFNLPNARPVDCRSVTLLAHSLSFCSYWDTHTQHTHAHTDAHMPNFYIFTHVVYAEKLTVL